MRKTINNVAVAFVKNHQRSSIMNTSGKTHNHIERQTKSYKRDNPSRKHKKALPPLVFEHQLKMATQTREKARAWLVCDALFFTMRSCEYTYVGKGKRRTRPIRAYNVVF